MWTKLTMKDKKIILRALMQYLDELYTKDTINNVVKVTGYTEKQVLSVQKKLWKVII